MLYIFSIILLLVLILIIQKSKEKINFIKTITITLIALFAYNTFVCYILNFINIPITLINLSIVNFIISTLLIGKIIKDKQIQKYEIQKKDIISTTIILLIMIITIAVNFRGISRIKYISMDAVNHYKAAREFSENTTLFDKATENTTTSKCFMPMGYVNVGILFKIFRPWIGTINLYKLYILFEAIVYFLVGIIFYFCLQNKIKTKNQLLVGILLSIFFAVGYPFNALICGFHYLILGILYFIAIFDIITNIIQTQKIEFKYILILLTLFNIGLIFSYALFCPFIYLAEFVYFIMRYRKNKNKKELFLLIAFPLILTGLMGCDIVLLQRISEFGTTGIEFDGWIYENTISNIIIFIPFTIYYILKLIKEKNKIYEKNLLLFFIIFFLILAIGTKLELCSSYYFYKNYYILSFFMFYITGNIINEMIEKGNTKKYTANIFMSFYIFTFVLCNLCIDTPINLNSKDRNENINIMEVYTFNKTNSLIDIPFLTKGELGILDKLDAVLENNWKNNHNILMIGRPAQEKWLQSLTGYEQSIFQNTSEYIKKWNNGNYKYLITFETRDTYEMLKTQIEFNEAEVLYENQDGKIYIKKRRIKMKLLLHSCCAPCSVYCIDSLREEGIEPTIYWYNPNIHPYMEYKARRDCLKEYTESIKVKAIFEEEYGLDEFCKNVIGDLKNRCANYCYKVRLEQTAKYAKENGYDTISTTLLISLYQNQEILKEIGEKVAKEYGLTFLYRDFRVGFREGQAKARELGLYMQKYCGCIFSEEMRYYNRNSIQTSNTNGYEIPKEPRMQVKKIENKEDYIDLLLEADPSKDMIHKYLNDSDVYALKKEDELISIAVILHIDRKTLELKNIVTKENYRNKGYAKTLLKSLCGNYKQKYDRMLVGTTENNIPFYVKQGFDKYEKTIKNFFIDNYKEEIKDGELTCTDLIYYSKDLKKK